MSSERNGVSSASNAARAASSSGRGTSSTNENRPLPLARKSPGLLPRRSAKIFSS